ncbi:MAG TPA: TonB family protein [Bryobacteraceae bacterium]|jgi:TonB family protein|nr:TonB family protein [Bryobacteraceae bacterium]
MPASTHGFFFAAVAVKSAAVVCLALLGAWCLRKRSAGTRHIVWTAVFLSLWVLPLLCWSLPGFRVPVPGALLGAHFTFRSLATASPAIAGSAGTPAAVHREGSGGAPVNWPMALVLLWGAGAVIGLAQIPIGLLATWRMRRRAIPFSEPALDSLRTLLQINRRVRVFKTSRGSMPLACGITQPAIFVPSDVGEWSAERRRAVYLHELAHVKRSDSAVQVMARIALSVYWWNPLVWIAWREFLKDRERAADDLVLSAGTPAPEYAAHLLDIARSMQAAAPLAWPGVAMARRSQLEGRLLAILDTTRDRRLPGRTPVVLACVLAVAIVFPVAAMQTGATGASVRAANSSAALIRQGDAYRENRDFETAKALYANALALEHTGPRAAAALIHRGTVLLEENQPEEAIRDFESAEAADPDAKSEAILWMAIARRHQNEMAAAAALFGDALAAAKPGSAESATIQEVYAGLLDHLGRASEAKSLQEQSRAIRASLAEASAPEFRPDLYHIGGSVRAPVPIFKPEPEYTEEARLAKYQGTAVVTIEIGVDGGVHNAQVARTLGFGLDRKAVETVEQWKFRPATKDGEPVAVAATIEVNFRLL